MHFLERQVVANDGRLQPDRFEQRAHQGHGHGVRRATLTLADGKDASEQLAWLGLGLGLGLKLGLGLGVGVGVANLAATAVRASAKPSALAQTD